MAARSYQESEARAREGLVLEIIKLPAVVSTKDAVVALTIAAVFQQRATIEVKRFRDEFTYEIYLSPRATDPIDDHRKVHEQMRHEADLITMAIDLSRAQSGASPIPPVQKSEERR